MRALTSKGGDILSHFDKIDESQAQMENTSLEHLLFNILDEAANERKFKGLHLPLLKKFLGFAKLFKKLLNN